ncbi:MAG: biotin--[acetyl-CoA-carboxylase] ligase [Candidatus Margulisiibacteriota bacterium]
MIGHTVVRLDETSSTNDIAKELSSGLNADGMVVLSGRQTKGKGRLGRQWFSPPDTGIYLSIILKSPLQEHFSSILCPAVSLAVVRTIEYFSSLKPLIKWPNDIIVNSKKVGGILVEKNGDAFIVGIGVNLNTETQEFPEEIKDKATSLKVESGKHWDKEDFLKKLFISFEEILSQLRAEGGDKSLLDKVKDRSFTLGKTVKVTDGKRTFHGEACGFESDGSLLLKTADGKIVNIKSGET